MLKLEDLVVDREFEELLPVLTPEEFERFKSRVGNIKRGDEHGKRKPLFRIF